MMFTAQMSWSNLHSWDFRFSHQQNGKVRGSKTRDNEAWSPEIFYYEHFALKGFFPYRILNMGRGFKGFI